MHAPLETQQEHKPENEPKSTLNTEGEVSRVTVEKEEASSKEGPIETDNHAGGETGTGNSTDRDVDDNGAKGDADPMDADSVNMQDDNHYKKDGVDDVGGAGGHESENDGKATNGGSGVPQQDEEQPEATPAAESDAMQVDEKQSGDEKISSEHGGGASANGEERKPDALVESEAENEKKEERDTETMDVERESKPDAPADKEVEKDLKDERDTEAMEVEGTSAGHNGNSVEKKTVAPSTDSAPKTEPAPPSTDSAPKTESSEKTVSKPKGDGAAPAAPPPPVLKGTLSYNEEQRRHIIRGMWNYENSNALPPQRFELIRNLNTDEDAKMLPKDGEFHGSFSLAYFHTTSKGKQKERSKVIPESGVNITFTKVQGKDKEYRVDGEGTNQFGVFYINGTASPSAHEGDPSYNIELRKRYKPTPASAQPATGGAAGGGSKKKKSKKRKHGIVGTSAPMDDEEEGAGQADVDGPLPPPSQSHPSHVVCLRGKMSRQESDDLGVTEVVHRISGMWASGLDLIEADPQNLRGLCNRFEYEHKMSVANDVFPLPGRYTGWFDLSQTDGTRTRISERDVTLKFRKNNAGFYNVEGRGSNSFGKYKITGTLSTDNVLTIFRHFQPLKKKESSAPKNSGAVTAAPPPLRGAGRAKSLTAQTPALPLLKLDEVVLPEGDDPPKPIAPLVHGTYSAVSRGVLRLNDDGAHTCSGKWAMTREHFINGTTSNFQLRLEPHFATEAVALMNKAKDSGNQKDAEGTAAAPSGTKAFPVDSAMYKGSFQMRRGGSKYTTIIDQQVVLKFRKNSAVESYNVHGKGINKIGVFTLVGTLILSGKNSGHIDLYRVYPVVPKPATGPAAGASSKPGMLPKRPSSTKDGRPVDGAVASAGGTIPDTSKMLPGPPRPTALQRRESSRLVKLPSRLEDDDPEAQMARIMDKCGHILKFMHEKDIASGAFFSEPVDPVAHGIPTYHEIISDPMDLGTIKKKMDAHEISTPEEFARLVRLVFENAMTFNIEPTHVVHQAGRTLLIIFNQKFRDVERMVENIRRSHKPTEAELREAEREKKRQEKEEAKRAKKQAKEDKKRKLSGGSEHGRASKRTRLEEAQAMAAANASAMAAIRAAAPANAMSGGSVTRAEFNLLLQMMQQLQGQLAQIHMAAANAQVSGDGDVSVASGLAAAAADQGYSALSGKPSKKKSEPKGYDIPVVENLKPLTLKEQEVLTDTINGLGSDRLQGVIDIIRESATLNGDEDEIDLDIDQLDTATQRKLQRYVSKVRACNCVPVEFCVAAAFAYRSYSVPIPF